MKKLRLVLMGLAGLLLILMITLMVMTNIQEKSLVAFPNMKVQILMTYQNPKR